MSDYEQNPINGSQPPQGDSQSNTGYTAYQQPGTYYTPPQPEQPQTPPTGDNGTTYHYAYHSGNQPGAAYNGQPVPLTIPPRHSPPARLTALPQSRRSRASRKKRRTKRPLPSW